MLCNAHLDPVWLWQRREGMAEAISTFRVAAKFCTEYDGFIFNHNESVLYEWVEENEPELFEEIRKAVKSGKWQITGGWYLQPDCLLPSGESFIRQIETGNGYFKEKFGIKPKTAVNYDSFGHANGLVQILKKCGYEHYVFHRPFRTSEDDDFIWKGYDGSEIVGHISHYGYNSAKGKITEKLENVINCVGDGPTLLLWGIGNHGGGPSKADLDAIAEYSRTHKDILVKHSSFDEYFEKIDKSKFTFTKNTSLVHCMVGCYTTMVRIKQLHRALENELNLCEKMIAVSGIDYSENELLEAQKSLLFCEFHDILPGTMIKSAEDDSLRLLNYGREIASKICAKAFFKLCTGEPEGKSGEIPVLVFNPNPYPITQDIEVEFQLEDQNRNENEVTVATAYDSDGNALATQNEQEESNVNLDWRKRIVFRAELKPMCINRFDCKLKRLNLPRRPIGICEETDGAFVIKNKKREIRISKKTGLIEKFSIDGIDRLLPESGKINVYADNEDPWGMTVDGFFDKKGEFVLASGEESDVFNGYPDEKRENVRIIENGDVRCKIQATFKHGNSFAVVTYTVPKADSYIDIHVKTFINDVNTMYKISFATTLENPKAISQMVFGKEEMHKNNKEAVCQKWCGLFEHGKGVAVLNRGTHGYSVDGNLLNISLLRTPIYSAHPIDDKPIVDKDRWQNHIDMGERDFDLRLTADITHLDKDAEVYNQQPYALSFFPSGKGEKLNTTAVLSNENIIMSGMKKLSNGDIRVHLFNSTDVPAETEFKFAEKTAFIPFSPFEIKAFRISENAVCECGLTDN